MACLVDVVRASSAHRLATVGRRARDAREKELWFGSSSWAWRAIVVGWWGPLEAWSGDRVGLPSRILAPSASTTLRSGQRRRTSFPVLFNYALVVNRYAGSGAESHAPRPKLTVRGDS